jgi:queuine tRNA-ribosyltransferase
MRNKQWETDFSPLEADGASSVDTTHSKAYLHHLFKVNEILALQIASIHNLAFYLWLMKEARRHIFKGDFVQWKTAVTPCLQNRISQ